MYKDHFQQKGDLESLKLENAKLTGDFDNNEKKLKSVNKLLKDKNKDQRS